MAQLPTALSASFRGGLFALCAAGLIAAPRAQAADASTADADGGANSAANSEAALPAGHSLHGEAFNEGPRQAAVLIEGMGNIDFPITASDPRTKAFFNQGVAALHGFWYLEAERSFRQAAAIEPQVAMLYWGMAMANTNNRKRAQGLIAQATERREQASEREKRYIDALQKYVAEPDKPESDDDKKQREQRYIKDLEKVLDHSPEDIEAKAFLALHLWSASSKGLPLTSHYAVDALLADVLRTNPMHPVHHYRIHLWDSERPENALTAAASCGPSLPAVAHMWHMPGHTYSKLHRYADAAWQQEASARVDHAHMIRTRLMPDQIHNFAHNNEWLTRNLIFLGRVQNALTQSRNLVAMPQHPRYNSLTKQGSFRYGRTRLLQTLTEYELWQLLLDEAERPYLPQTSDPEMQSERLAWIGVAHHLLGQTKQAERLHRELRRRLIAVQSDQLDLEEQLDSEGEKADDSTPQSQEERRNRNKKQIEQLDQAIARVEVAAAVHKRDAEAVKRRLAEAGSIDDVLQASWLAQAGAANEAIEKLERLVKDRPGQVRPLAILIHTLWEAGQQDRAVEHFATLRSLAGGADLDTPLLARLSMVAEKAGLSGDWRTPAPPAADLGERPVLETLGPVRWSPSAAPQWAATDLEGNPVSDETLRGRPHIVIFYLGFGCLHCVEQLSAFKPQAAAFEAAGVDVVGISTESMEDFAKGMQRFDEEIPFPLMADPTHAAFHAFGCWDDFEDQPLHGTFLIDAQGRVRWQDIGHEPFTDAAFLVEEAPRLLALPE